MKKRSTAVLLAVLLLFALLPGSGAAEEEQPWWEQDLWDTEVLSELGAVLPTYDAAKDRYEIATPEQLLYLSGVWKTGDSNGDGAPDAPCNGTYVLTADLDMAPLLTSIGAVLSEKRGEDVKGYMPPIAALADGDESEGVHCAFFGTFDGQGHAIRNLRVVRMGDKYCGLFGNVGHDFGEGFVKDLAILDAEIVGLATCGILAGGFYGDADNVVCTGTIDCAEKNAGGLVGKIKRNENGYYGIARNCFVYCDILVRGQGVENGAAGGVSASNSKGGQIVNCFVGGSIRIEGEEADSVGGIVGNLKGGTAIDNNVMLLKTIDGGTDSQNIGFLCGSYSGESGSHIHNNVVWEGTVLTGGVASAHPEGAAYELASAQQIGEKALYEQLGWDFDAIWTWVGDDAHGYPMIRAFRDALDMQERLQRDLAVETPVIRLFEPMANSAYAGDPVAIDLQMLLPDGLEASEATLYYGTSKTRSACTESIPMTIAEGIASAEFSADEPGIFYYYCAVRIGNEEFAFPTEGTVRLDVVSPTTRYMPEQLTITPGATASEVCFNWITASDGLTGELCYRKAGASDWQKLPVTEIETVQVRGDHGTFTSYSADVAGLEPASAYEYMAVTSDGTDESRSDVNTFTTLPDGNTFSFVAISDLQSTNEEGYLPFLYTHRAFLTDTLHPDFMVNLGDLTEDDTMQEWSFLFDTAGEALATRLTAYVAGNHEAKGDVVYSHFKGRTNLPGGIDDPILRETTSSFVVGDVCFVTMNTDPFSGEDGTDASADKLNYYAAQKEWAKRVFETSGCTYRVIFAHAGLVQKDDAATAFLEKMCGELDVCLFLNGHIHNYFRATVDGEGKKTDTASGTTFVTTSPMGPKFDDYGGEIDDVLGFQTGGSDDARQYLTYVEVTDDGITVTAYQRTEAGDANIKKCADYTPIDTFTIHREPHRNSTRWILIAVAAAALAAVVILAVILLRKRKTAKK